MAAPTTIWTNAVILLIWTLVKKIEWHTYQNVYIFVREIAFENDAWKMKMVVLLSRPQYVNVVIRDITHFTYKENVPTLSYYNRRLYVPR